MLTLIGIMCGIGLMVVAIMHAGAPFRLYGDLAAGLIVLGGSIAATLVSYPAQYVLRGLRGIIDIFKKGEYDFVRFLNEMAEVSVKFTKEGITGIEAYATALPSCLLKDGLNLIVNGYNRTEIFRILDENNRLRMQRHNSEVQLFRTMAKSAPAFGLVGTLTGLIYMLSAMGSHPEKLGQGLSVALVATLYGVLVSNLFFNPIAEKLQAYAEDNFLLGSMQVQGIIMIMEKRHPLYIKDNLIAFIPPKQRAKAAAAEKKK